MRFRNAGQKWGISAPLPGTRTRWKQPRRFLKFYYSEGIYENVLKPNGDSVTVRPVRGMDTQDQAIIKALFCEPVRTWERRIMLRSPMDFTSNGWWIPSGGKRTSYLADDLTPSGRGRPHDTEKES